MKRKREKISNLMKPPLDGSLGTGTQKVFDAVITEVNEEYEETKSGDAS
jgi:hypothetical protein